MPLIWLSLALILGIVMGGWSSAFGQLASIRFAWWGLAGLSALLFLFWLRRRGGPGYEAGAAHPAGSAPPAGAAAQDDVHVAGNLPTSTSPQYLRALRPPVPFPSLLLLLALGALRYLYSLPTPSPKQLLWYNDKPMKWVIEGVVVEAPDERDTYISIKVSARRLRPERGADWIPIKGLLAAQLPTGIEWRYGDLVQLEGWLQTPPEAEEFSYRDYLARQGVYSQLFKAQAALLRRGEGFIWMEWIYRLQSEGLGMVYRLFPGPEASLLAGILLGVDKGMPQDLQQAFRDTGTAHIIAISGFNIAILSGLFASLFTRGLGRRRGALAAALGIAFYTLLVGAQASVVRAAIMGGLSLLARQVGRRQQGLNSLAFTAGVMALIQPTVIWDVGFQLSFMATLGLVLYAEPLSLGFIRLASRQVPQAWAVRAARPVGEYFLFTLAAQATTLPIVLYHFQRLSLISILANPLILPVQPAVMVFSGLAMMLGWIFLPLGQFAAWIAWPFAAYTIRVVELFAQVPHGVMALGKLGLPAALFLYASLFVITLAPRSLPAAFHLRPALVAAACAALAAIVWQSVQAAPDGRLHLTVLDVSLSETSGEALLIRTPQGRYILIGGGPSPSRLSDALGRRLPILHPQIDYLVVAAGNSGHLDGLARNLERFPVERVLWATSSGGYQSQELRSELSRLKAAVIPAEEGSGLDLGSGASLKIEAMSRLGSILSLKWKNFRALLSFGADENSLRRLQADPSLRQVSVFLFDASGEAASNPPDWIAGQLRPQLLLLSISPGERRELPSPQVMEAVQGFPLLRTDQHGWIEIATDGDKMWVEVEKTGSLK